MKQKLGPLFGFKLGPLFNLKTPKSWTTIYSVYIYIYIYAGVLRCRCFFEGSAAICNFGVFLGAMAIFCHFWGSTLHVILEAVFTSKRPKFAREGAGTAEPRGQAATMFVLGFFCSKLRK